MTARPRLGHMRKTRLLAGAAVSFTAAILVGTSGTSSAAPCDIYAAGNTPCVAAHSTTRALFDAYTGPLYRILRADGKTLNIAPLEAGGVANATAQESFCQGTTCLISVIFDQTERGNHLTKAPSGSAGGGTDPNNFDNL